jgi:hypothetical protein
MADATGEAKEPSLRVAFDRRLKLELHVPIELQAFKDHNRGGYQCHPGNLRLN